MKYSFFKLAVLSVKESDLTGFLRSKNQFEPVANKCFLVKDLVCKIKKKPDFAT